jgi:hypothetical protein
VAAAGSRAAGSGIGPAHAGADRRVVAVLVLPAIYPDLPAGSRSALEAIDLGIWTVVLAEYLARLFVAPDRLAFVRRSGEPWDYVRPGNEPRDHRRPQRAVLLFMYQGTVDVASIRIWLRDPVLDLRDTA